MRMGDEAWHRAAAVAHADAHTEPLASRIATDLHEIGLAMKQQPWQRANDERLAATEGQLLAPLVTHGRSPGRS